MNNIIDTHSYSAKNAQSTEFYMGKIKAGGKTYDVFLTYEDDQGKSMPFPPQFDYMGFEKAKEYSLEMLGHLTDFHQKQLPEDHIISYIDEKGAHLAGSDEVKTHDVFLDPDTKEKANQTFHNRYPGVTSSLVTAKELYQEATSYAPPKKTGEAPSDLSVNLQAELKPTPLAETTDLEKIFSKEEPASQKEQPASTNFDQLFSKEDPKFDQLFSKKEPKEEEKTEETPIQKDSTLPLNPSPKQEQEEIPLEMPKTISENLNQYFLDKLDLARNEKQQLTKDQEEMLQYLRNRLRKGKPQASEDEIEKDLDQFFLDCFNHLKYVN